MLNELENKIRKAIPELNEVSKGTIIKSKYYGIAELIHYDSDYFNYLFVDEKLQYRSDNEKNIEIIGKPIQLNHVLEYWKNNTQVTTASKFKNDLHWILFEWNLKSNLLSEQSEQLIKFVNELEPPL